MNEAKLIGKNLHIYEHSRIGDPRIVNMTNLRHPVTKSGVDYDEENDKEEEDNEDNDGN